METYRNPNFRIGMQEHEDVNNLTFQLTDATDPDHEQAISVYNPDGAFTPTELEIAARDKFSEKCWWMNEYWKNKGLPKEQITIKVGEQPIELYNFGVDLTFEQALELQKIIGKLSAGKAKAKLSGLKYILIDDTDVIDKKTNQARRGYAYPEMKTIALNPRAVSNEPHRVPGVSSFAGTVSHEAGHIFAYGDIAFMNEWKKKFNWEYLPDEEIRLVGDMHITHKNTQPEKLVSTYASFSPEEDVCDSLAAATNNPDVLDKERLSFLEEQWLENNNEPGEQVTLTRKINSEIELPKTNQPVKYKTYGSRRIQLGKAVRGEANPAT